MTNYVKEYKGHKVPVGATHAREFCGGSIEFYKSGFYFRQADHSWRRQTRVENFHESTELPQEPESKEWVYGLPPVGCECEYETTFFTLDKFTKGECSIIAFYKDRVWVDIKGSGEFVINLKKIKFRPLKTEKEKEREYNLCYLKSLQPTIHGSCADKIQEYLNDYANLLLKAGFKAPEGE